jgi:tetratricopeptide (TPR) repeat protein
MPRPAAESVPGAAAQGRRWLLSPWGPTILGVLCLANSLGNGFVYDDHPLIEKNPRIRHVGDLAIWTSDWWKVVEDQPNLGPQRDYLWRPLSLFSFALNYTVHGYAPAGYHLLNVLLHGAVCFALWHFARRLTGSAATASLAAVLFALHPVHAEAVANVVGRAEVLAALFLLAGCLCLQTGSAVSPLRALAAAGCFLPALLAKETAVCYLPVALLVLAARRRQAASGGPDRGPRPWRWWLTRAALLALPLLLYFPLRYHALEGHLLRGRPADDLMNPLVLATPLQRVVGACTVLGEYTRLLLVPSRLSSDYGADIVAPQNGFTLSALVGIGAGVGLLALLIGLRRRGGAWWLAGLLAALFGASYALISNTVLLIGVSLAERLMYWPSALVLVLVAVGLMEFWRRQLAPGRPLAARARLLQTLGVLVLAALGLRTALRSADWADDLTLFTQDVRSQPRGAHLNKSLAVELLRAEDRLPNPALRDAYRRRAAECLEAALAIRPGYADALVYRGELRGRQGDWAGARQDFEHALVLTPGNREARQALAKMSALTTTSAAGGTTLAELRAAVAAHPDEAAARLALGVAARQEGLFEEAREHLARAAELTPDDATSLREYAKTLAVLGEPDAARAWFQRAVERDPNDWQSHANLANLLVDQDAPAALRHAERAAALQPDDLRVQVNLAGVYRANRRIAEAAALYRRIIASLPPNDPLRRSVAQHLANLEKDGR